MLPPDAKMRSVELHERSPAVASLLVGMMASGVFMELEKDLTEFPPSSRSVHYKYMQKISRQYFQTNMFFDIPRIKNPRPNSL